MCDIESSPALHDVKAPAEAQRSYLEIFVSAGQAKAAAGYNRGSCTPGTTSEEQSHVGVS